MPNILSKVYNLVKRAIITLPIQDNEQYQVAQIQYMGKTSTAQIINPYGLDSNMPEGSLLVVFNVQCQEENKVAIGNKSEIRFKDLKPGEVVVGNPITRSNIFFEANGDITIKGTANVNINVTGNINITTPQVNLTGDLNVTGTITATTDVVGGGKSLATHVHTGVTPGIGNTGPPL